MKNLLANNQFIRILTVCLLIGSLLLFEREAVAEGSSPGTQTLQRDYLVLGKVTTNPKKHYKTMMPMARYLVAQMEDLGIREARVLFAKDLQQMSYYLNTGQIDFVTETPIGAALLMDEAGAEPLLLRWKKGVRDYQSLIFVREDSGIGTLDALQGKTIAFEDSGSTSAYFLPKHYLQEQGLELVAQGSPRDRPADKRVGYVFSGAEQNTSAWVYGGLVDAGAVNNQDWSKPDHMPQAQREKFKIIHRSESVPRAIELLRKNMPDTVAVRIKTILLQIHQDDSAKAALKAYQKTTLFEPLEQQHIELLQKYKYIARQSGV